MDTPWLGEGRDVVVVEGPDAASYLQSQVSQDLRGMAPGQSQWTFLLEPNGKIDVLARVTMVGDDRFELDTDPGFGQVLEARLNRFKIRVKAVTCEVSVPIMPSRRSAPAAKREVIKILAKSFTPGIVPDVG